MATSLWTGHWRGNSPNGDAHRRSREVISPSGGIMRCKFPRRKNGRLVHCEGLLELDAAYLFEASPQIKVFREQPTKTHFPDGDRVRRYTPDFELILSTGDTVWAEVKPLCSLENPVVRHRLKMVREHMARSERRFAVVSDDVLRLEPRRANLRQIFHRASPKPPTVEEAMVGLRRCAEELPAPLHRAIAALAKVGLLPYSLLLIGLLRCDLSAPLGQLADRVEHRSVKDGDGLGYDVLSFEVDGTERFIEVKTTSFSEETPFFVTANELAFARSEPSRFKLCRVFDFRVAPRFFELAGPVEQHFYLDPATYRASLQ